MVPISRTAVWLSKLSSDEKEDIKTVGKGYIDDFFNIGIRLGSIRRRAEEIFTYNISEEVFNEARKELESINKEDFKKSFEVCVSKKETLDEIISCVKDLTKLKVLPESIGAMLADNLNFDRKKYQLIEV